jgi:arylsulfatase A
MTMNRYYALLVGLLAAAPQPCGASADRPPNLVVILMDDLGYADIAPFGSTLNRTPELDRMAREGMRLAHFYAAPVCTAARAQLLTGSYSKRVSLNGALAPVSSRGLNAEETTVAELLQGRGYATMHVGKWHLGDQPEFLPTRHGFDRFFGLPYSNDMGERAADQAKAIAGRPPLPLLRDEVVIETSPLQSQLTERFTQESLHFIRENRDRPFFLYLAHIATHVPIHPGAAFAGKSANGPYGDWVEESDWSVGRVLELLRESGLDRTTLVLFTSDNGPWLEKRNKGGVATPLRGGKFSCLEGGLRVPAIAWWPGRIPAGASSDAVVGLLDVLPTAARLAGADLPEGLVIDGVDIWPVLSGEARESSRESLFYWEGQALAGVRSGPWKLLVRPQKAVETDAARDPETFSPQLYHVMDDPGETTDRAAEHPEIVARLLARIDEMDRDLGRRGNRAPGIRPAGHVANPRPLLQQPIGAR